jgi:hypothetical protein
MQTFEGRNSTLVIARPIGAVVTVTISGPRLATRA